MPYCIKCGAMLDENALFCAKCGTRVDDQDTAQPTPQQKQEEPATNRVSQKPTQQVKPIPQTEPKKKLKVGIFVAIAVAAIAIIGAGAFGVYKYMHNDDELEEVIEYASYLKSKQFLFDMKVMDRAAELNTDLELLYMDFLTDGFSKNIGDNTKEYFEENQEYYWNMLISIDDQAEAEGDMYQVSLDRLHKSGALTSNLTVDENGNGHLEKYAMYNDDAEEIAMNSFHISDLFVTPAYAGPIQSGYDSRKVDKMTKRQVRYKLVNIAQQLSGEDLRDLFKEIPSEYKNGETDFKGWWQDLSDGKYDNYAYRILKDLHTTDAVHGENAPAKQRFYDLAEKMGAESQKVFADIARQQFKAKANLAKDLSLLELTLLAGRTAAGKDAKDFMSAGLDTGSDIVVLYDQTNASISDKTEIFGRRALDKAMENLTLFGRKVSPILGAGDVIDMLKVGGDCIKEWVKGDRDRPQIDWESKRIPGKLLLSDDDKDTPAVMAVVYNPMTGEEYATEYKDENGNFVIDVFDAKDNDFMVVSLYDDEGGKVTRHVNAPKPGEKVNKTFTSEDEWSTLNHDVLQRVDRDALEKDEKLAKEMNKDSNAGWFKETFNWVTGRDKKQDANYDKKHNDIESARSINKNIKEALDERIKAKAEAKKAKAEEEARKKEEQRKKDELRKKREEEREKKEEERRRKEEAQKRAEGPGLFESWGNKLRDWAQGKINDFVEMNKTNEDEDDEDMGNVPPKPKDEDQKAREKISGLDENFFLGRWQCTTIAGNGMKLPPGLTPRITVVFNINGTWRGHMEAMNIPGGITIPAYDSSGRYSFDGFNLKYSTGEVFVVTKISENKVVTRDIRSGATATMTRIN